MEDKSKGIIGGGRAESNEGGIWKEFESKPIDETPKEVKPDFEEFFEKNKMVFKGIHAGEYLHREECEKLWNDLQGEIQSLRAMEKNIMPLYEEKVHQIKDLESKLSNTSTEIEEYKEILKDKINLIISEGGYNTESNSEGNYLEGLKRVRNLIDTI